MKGGYSSHVYPTQNPFAMTSNIDGVHFTNLMPIRVNENTKQIQLQNPQNWNMPLNLANPMQNQVFPNTATNTAPSQQMEPSTMQSEQSKIPKETSGGEVMSNKEQEFKNVNSVMPQSMSSMPPSHPPVMSASDTQTLMNRLQNGKFVIYQSMLISIIVTSSAVNPKMINNEKYSVLNSYLQPQQKVTTAADETSSKMAADGKLGDFYKQYMDNLSDPEGKKQTGILKFFNDGKGFGFLISDIDKKDIFFHFDDIKDIKLTKEFLRDAKNKFIVKFAFEVQIYYGRYNISQKAVNLELLGMFDQRFLLGAS